MIEVAVREEAGYVSALYGMSLSHNLVADGKLTDKKINRAKKLAPMQGGHSKFLESIMLWIDVNAPRYWWQQADTYRISTKQSGSTMHTIMKAPLSQDNFAGKVPPDWLRLLNDHIKNGAFEVVKALLPESFLQRRIWCLSYKTLQNIYLQRKNHRLKEWHQFFNQVLNQIEHPEFIKENESPVASRSTLQGYPAGFYDCSNDPIGKPAPLPHIPTKDDPVAPDNANEGLAYKALARVHVPGCGDPDFTGDCFACDRNDDAADDDA